LAVTINSDKKVNAETKLFVVLEEGLLFLAEEVEPRLEDRFSTDHAEVLVAS